MEAVITPPQEKTNKKTISTYEQERGKPMPSIQHSMVQGNLYFLLRLKYAEQYRFMPELSVKVDKEKHIPDISIYPSSLTYPAKDKVHIKKSPLGAIEILSPTQSLNELLDKCKTYFAEGAKSYWLVLPGLNGVFVFHAPEEYDFFGKDDTLVDKQLGIELGLKEVFM